MFDRRGACLGRLDLAPSTKMVAVLGNRIWVVEKAESGFRVPVRYRMVFPTG